MNDSSISQRLVLEETKAIKFFLLLFYVIFLSFEIFFIYFRPKYTRIGEIGIPTDGLGIWFYIAVIALLPMSLYFIKKGNPFIVKYLLLFCYIGIETIDIFLIYYGTDKTFGSGNIVELLFILFSPIFVNKKYFWTASLSTIGKYIFVGIVLKETNVTMLVITFIILSSIAFSLLTSFRSYVTSLDSVYQELRQKEKLAVIGQMAAAIAHEIRNPLSSLRGFTQLQQERHPNANDFYPIMIQEIDRINSIVNDLMTLGKPKVLKLSKANIEEIIAYSLSITQLQAERQQVMIETTMNGPLPPIDCDGKQLKQVFINLIKNAIEAMPDGGKIKINVNVTEDKKMKILIEDEGNGIDEAILPNLGEPFFTTKKEGTGLGLMVSNQIIQDHHGELLITGCQKGTLVKVILPVSQN